MSKREPTQHSPKTTAAPQLLVVGVGASVGGVEAFGKLLSELGQTDHLAIVYVQHLDRAGELLATELLSKQTAMEVIPLEHQMQLRGGSLYICPPHTLLDMKEGRILFAEEPKRPMTNPIDHFFHGLAEDQRERAVGIILSGGGSDGTLGLKAISDRGGVTFAQDPQSAHNDSMPRSASTTGVADHILTPDEIAHELLAYARHLRDLENSGWHDNWQREILEAIPAIVKKLLEVTEHNFQHYKTTTLARRIGRRMQVLKIARASEYVSYLQNNAEESQTLFRELLIGVTAFFRDPEAFELLAQQVLPKIFDARADDDCVRLWVAGCANGAEAYSLAMLCCEQLDGMQAPPKVQIFATDIDERALAIARAGCYPVGIEEQISPARLKRFFVKRGRRYQVTQELRELVLFSSHNLISDPPFSRQDLISCRNLLIYLGPHLQNKLIPLFHYALRPAGFLLLGPSENITSHGELFRTIDAKLRISQRKGTAVGSSIGLSARRDVPAVSAVSATPVDGNVDLTLVRQRIVLDEFAPKSCIIDESGQVLNASANMQKYLTLDEGDFQNNLLKMVASGLRIGLRAAVSEAKQTRRKVQHEHLSIRYEDKTQAVMLTVQPMPQLGEDEPLYLVVFHDLGLPIERDNLSANAVLNSRSHPSADSVIAQMERELETTRDDLDRSLQDMEAANQELKSSNEELLAMNEELQSANEELETSKEEIRAGSDAVARANADLENLLRSTRIATVFLDEDLRIRTFTPAITEIYGLLPSDVGRRLDQFVPLVDHMPPLPSPSSLTDSQSVEHTVLARNGRSYIRRVLPYHAHTGQSQGIVVTFTDVTDLRVSQEMFQLLVSASAQIVWLTNPDGQVELDSPSWREFTGQTVEQWQGKGWLEAVHCEDRDAIMAAWQDCIATGEPLSHEYRLRHHSDQWRWMHVRAIPQRTGDGSIRCWIGMNMDIHDRKEAQINLAGRESHLRRVIDNMLSFVGELDIDGTLLEANQTALVAGGLSRDDVIGRKFWDCYWWSYDAAIVQQLRQAIERSLSGETLRYDVVVRMAGDSRITIDFMLVPVRGPDGEITHLIASGVDISDRSRFEQALQETANRLRMALRAGGMAAWEWTPEKSFWTKELYELLGISSKQPASVELFFSLVHPDDVEDLKHSWQAAVDSTNDYDCEFRIVRPDGQVRWLRGMGEVERDHSGKVIRMFGLNWDSTDEQQNAAALRESERRANEASRSKSEFLANMSHEIRTPMTAILGYAELLVDLVDHDEARSHLQTIRRNGHFLVDIINDILDLSKIEAGKFDLDLERFSPLALIEDVRSIMQVRASEKQLQLSVEYPQSLPALIESDAKRLKQILINLVGNAIKFTRRGTVRLAVACRNNKLHIDIIDSGIGMSRAQLVRLFQPFSQGDQSISREFGGTGLGLAISHRLAHMLGGEICVDSQEGKGSRFSVSIDMGLTANIPLLPPSQVTVPVAKPANIDLATIHLNCRVLVVDDRREIRFLSKRFLSQAGALVDEAEDGQQAVAHIVEATAQGTAPDIVLLDMQMPKLDGYETALQLRQQGYSAPIIALTADAMQGDMNRCLECGCNDYLSKPIDKQKLITMVHHYTNPQFGY